MRGGPGRIGAAVAAIALAAAVFALYYPCLGYGFVYDDSELILANRWILSFSNIPEVFTTHTFGFKEGGYQAISYRPMLFLIYMAEYAFFGFSAWPWHLVNVVMHALNAVLVFFILRRMIESEGRGFASAMPAFAASLVFAVHPTNAETVSWLATMAELTFIFLCLAAFLVEARSIDGKSASRAGSVASRVVPALFFLSALLLKETAVVLPIIVFAYDVGRRGLGGFFSFQRLLRYLPYALAASVYAGMRAFALKGDITPRKTLHDFLSPYEFVLNSAELMARYLKSLVLPFGEPPLQLMDPVLSLSEPRALVSAVIVIAVPLALGVFLAKVTRLWPLVLAVIILPVLPTLYSPAISRFPYADRYLYFSTVGLAMHLAFVLAWSGKKRWSVLALALVLAAAVPFSALARHKSAAWESDMTLWTAALKAQPRNYVAVHSLAVEKIREGRPQDAVDGLERALDMNLKSAHPDESMVILTRKTLALAYLRSGMNDKAEAAIEAYLWLMPSDAPYLYSLAILKQDRGVSSDAIELYARAALFSRDAALSKMAYLNMGESYLALGMEGEALRSFREALKYSPGDPVVLGRIEAAGGRGGAR